MEYFQLIIGLIILIFSGEFLVKGAVGIALKLRISTLVIGMTIVSFGTSAPELLVSIKAAIMGMPDIALSAVIGSNIINIAFILGLTVLIFPLNVSSDTIAIDWPVMMVSSLLLYLFMLNGTIAAYEGAVLFILLSLFTFWLIRRSRKNNREEENELKEVKKGIVFLYLKDSVFVILGCLGLTYGADWFLTGANYIALDFGISERIIGLTLVAVGTSLPELITSLVAAFRKEMDISVGNLIGSNIFNILSILGVTSIIKEIQVNEQFLSFDIFWMLGISFIIFPLMLIGRKISRLDGVLLLSLYISYISLVIMD